MTEPILPSSNQPPEPLESPVKLWTPSTIGILTFLCGYPGGVILAFLNWRRMGFVKRANIHLITLLVGTVVLAAILILSSGGSGRWIGLGINIAITFYLYNRMEQDIAMFKGINPNIENAQLSGGCLISLLGIVFLLVISFLVSMFFYFIGV